MTKEEKDLLLRDLCGRLPYGVIVRLDYKDGTIVTREIGIGSFHDMLFGNAEGKSYLRPMSSMTEDEAKEFDELSKQLFEHREPEKIWADVVDWLNKHHFDYRGLIDKGLALEASEEMY